MSAVTATAIRAMRRNGGSARGRTARFSRSCRTEMATTETVNIFQRGGAGAVREGRGNQVSRPVSRWTCVASTRSSAVASSSERSPDSSQERRCATLSKRKTTCHGSPTWPGRSIPAPRKPGYCAAARVSAALKFSKSASLPGATLRAIVTVTGSVRGADRPAMSAHLRLPVPLLEGVADVHEEEGGGRPVEGPVVVDQTDDPGGVDRDRVADRDGTPLDAVRAEDPDVGLVDDGCGGVAGERARVGDRECRALHVRHG